MTTLSTRLVTGLKPAPRAGRILLGFALIDAAYCGSALPLAAFEPRWLLWRGRC